jgi:hypothetical protein
MLILRSLYMAKKIIQVSGYLVAQKCSNFWAVQHIRCMRAAAPSEPPGQGGTATLLFLYNEKRTNV